MVKRSTWTKSSLCSRRRYIPFLLSLPPSSPQPSASYLFIYLLLQMPLWLVFSNMDPFGDPVLSMFKAGDDLRQDQLTLQMIRIMDKMWYDAGLDLQTTFYRYHLPLLFSLSSILSISFYYFFHFSVVIFLLLLILWCRCVSTGPDEGWIEIVTEAVTIADIQKVHPSLSSHPLSLPLPLPLPFSHLSPLPLVHPFTHV